jgi:hypothetical protein
MPLPKNQNPDEWKRKIAMKTFVAKKNNLSVVESAKTDSERVSLKIEKNMEFSDIETKNIILIHAKLHNSIKSPPEGWSFDDIFSLHSKVVSELRGRKLNHVSYDYLDDIMDEYDKLDGDDGA